MTRELTMVLMMITRELRVFTMTTGLPVILAMMTTVIPIP